MRRAFAHSAALVLVASFVASASSAAPPLRLPEDIVAEAQNASGADVTYTVRAGDDSAGNPLTISCDNPPGSQAAGRLTASAQFPIAATTVTCTASDSTTTIASGSFLVTVRDTTPPVVTGIADQTVTTTDPAGASVSFGAPTASDAVDGAVVATCDHVSGVLYPVGATVVTCTATDSRGNTGSASFTVNVVLVDTTPPVVTLSGDVTVVTESPAGAVVTYSASAADNIDGSLTPACDHAPGSLFPVGTTSVTCTATDSHGNTGSAGLTATVVLVDTTPPVVSVPGDLTIETENPAGANVSYSASATDNVDGSLTPTCDHPSGSFFPVGTTAVSCTATDSHGNTGNAGLTVSVVFVDRTAPAFSGIPANIATEANGPPGSVVIYKPPVAVDAVDGPIADIVCTPPSGTTFGLGVTTVTCSATDSHGNTGSASFTVAVHDTTPPILRAPTEITLDATTATGIPASDGALAAFLGAATASDIVDQHPSVTNDAPAFFPVGTTVVRFTATDSSGNAAVATASVIVLPQPPPGTPPRPAPATPDLTPPDEVSNLQATAGPGSVRLNWTRPRASDFDHVVVLRSQPDVPDEQRVVYSGTGSAVVDRAVRNGVTYRYVVVSFDRAGNRSAGVATVAMPKAILLVAPPDGARVRKPPVLRWVASQGASYYNVQLFRGTRKVLSAWPKKNRLALTRSWKYLGRTYRLSPGLYRWYVWPGLGAPAAATYGEQLGVSTFQML